MNCNRMIETQNLYIVPTANRYLRKRTSDNISKIKNLRIGPMANEYLRAGSTVHHRDTQWEGSRADHCEPCVFCISPRV